MLNYKNNLLRIRVFSYPNKSEKFIFSSFQLWLQLLDERQSLNVMRFLLAINK